MSESTPSPFRYPKQVYYSLQINPATMKQCSDPQADFILCKHGRFFNGVTRPSKSMNLTLHFPKDKFDSKLSSRGMQFYRAKDPEFCTGVEFAAKTCKERLKLISGGTLVGHLGRTHPEHLKHTGIPGIEKTIFM